MILEKIDSTDFDAIYAEMEQNFVLEERRDKAHARAVLEDPNYTAFHLVKDGIRVGFVTIWYELIVASHPGTTFQVWILRHVCALEIAFQTPETVPAPIGLLPARFATLRTPLTPMSARVPVV